MVKSKIMMLTGRENVDVANDDVSVGWILQPTVEALVIKGEKKLM
jgi:hypothetical protein